MERLRNSDPVGFWKVPPEVWADEEAMDEFAEGLANHMSGVGDGMEVEQGTEESRDS